MAQDPRELLVSHQDQGIGLVIPEENVVPGLMLLDEALLQDQGIGLRGGHRILDAPDGRHQGPGLGRRGHCGKIGAEAIGQFLGLAHIDHIPRGTVHPVDPGKLRHRPEKLPVIKFPTRSGRLNRRGGRIRN